MECNGNADNAPLRDRLSRENGVLPELQVVAIDESYGCDEEFLARCGGKLYGVYLFDARRVHYICSFQPSYECWYLYALPEAFPEGDDPAYDKLVDELEECDLEAEEVQYFNCGVVDAVPLGDLRRVYGDLSKLPRGDSNFDLTYKEILEDAIEFSRCNHLI